MAAAATDILTPEEAKRAVGKTGTLSEVEVTRLEMLTTAMSEATDAYCGPVIQREVTETVDGGRAHLWLRHTPVANVVSLTEYSGTTATALTSSSNTSQPSTGFLVTEQGKVSRRSGNGPAWFPDGNRNVVVVYTAGRYTHATASDAGLTKFKQALSLDLRDVWQSGNGMGTETFGGDDAAGAFVTLGPEMLNRVRRLLHREMQAPALG